MAAYLIARIEVTDLDKYKNYIALAPAALAQFGGEYLVRGGATETLEGDEEMRRIVIVKFPSMDQARACYNSEIYQAAKAERDGAAIAQFVIADGL